MTTLPEFSGQLRARAAHLSRPSGPLPRPDNRARAFDALLALLVGAVTAYSTYNYGSDSFAPDPERVAGQLPPPPGEMELWIVIPVALAAAAPLAVRRRYPLAALWVVLAVLLVAPGEGPRLGFVACVITAYSAAAYSPYRLAVLLSLPVTLLLIGFDEDSAPLTVPTEYIPLLTLVPLAVAANGMRTWKLRTDEGRTRLTALEAERAEELRRAVEEERARIARELHDVVTHNVSVMVIQAGAARKVMDASPEQARQALLAVESGGRAAMGELRQVMGLLALDGRGEQPNGPPELAPQPGVEQVEALVGRIRDSGVPVELTVSGAARPIPSGIGLAAYRVVQEALTNTVRHAAGASAAVLLDYRDGELLVEVTDTGGRPAPGAAPGGGRGLIGLRERLAVYGGSLRSGPRPAGGGYRVRALRPLEER